MTLDTRTPPQTQATDQDRLLDHEYDGIREYDNPLPRWWLWIFYATIAYSALYALNVPGIGAGKGRIASYEREMEQARQRAQALAAQHPALEVSDAALVAASRDPRAIASGRETFAISCAPCHRADGGGTIGPNLTDGYWIHGAEPVAIHGIIAAGVADKGMPAWQTMLAPDRVFDVAAYVLTLRGTHPPDPKPPQGVEAESDADHGAGSSQSYGEPGGGTQSELRRSGG